MTEWSGYDCLFLFEAVGGLNNIIEIEACFTRFRLLLKDIERVSEKKLRTLRGVKDVIMRGDEVHLVIGMEVIKLCEQCQKYIDNNQ